MILKLYVVPLLLTYGAAMRLVEGSYTESLFLGLGALAITGITPVSRKR